jgi:hypothetical protein
MLRVTYKPFLLSVIMLNVVMLSVVMLSVLAQVENRKHPKLYLVEILAKMASPDPQERRDTSKIGF